MTLNHHEHTRPRRKEKGDSQVAHPCPWAVDLGVPLLAIQANLHTLADEEAGPHEDVAQGALALVIQGEVQYH